MFTLPQSPYGDSSLKEGASISSKKHQQCKLYICAHTLTSLVREVAISGRQSGN